MKREKNWPAVRLLICGLPGTGKSWLAQALKAEWEKEGAKVQTFDGDEVREMTGNWDFSETGRKWQAETMNGLARQAQNAGAIAIASFICPTQQLRAVFRYGNERTFVIWLNRRSAKAEKFVDTLALWENPGGKDDPVHFKISHWQRRNSEAKMIVKRIGRWTGAGPKAGPKATAEEGKEIKVCEGG